MCVSVPFCRGTLGRIVVCDFAVSWAQLSMKSVTLINTVGFKHLLARYIQHRRFKVVSSFSFYWQLIFHAQLSWALRRFYNHGYSTKPSSQTYVMKVKNESTNTCKDEERSVRGGGGVLKTFCIHHFFHRGPSLNKQLDPSFSRVGGGDVRISISKET